MREDGREVWGKVMRTKCDRGDIKKVRKLTLDEMVCKFEELGRHHQQAAADLFDENIPAIQFDKIRHQHWKDGTSTSCFYLIIWGHTGKVVYLQGVYENFLQFFSNHNYSK